jgi:SPW repeat
MASPASPTIEEHPDIVGMRMRYEQAAEAPMAQLLEGLGFLAGLYLAISPWVLGFNNLPTLTANNLIIGIAVAGLAAGFASAFGRTHGMTWVAPIIGIWTILAPWLVSGNVNTTTAVINNVVTGAVILLFGLGATSVGMQRLRR